MIKILILPWTHSTRWI